MEETVSFELPFAPDSFKESVNAVEDTSEVIARTAKKYNIPTIVLAGKISDDIEALYDLGVTSVFGIVDIPKTLEEALKDGYKSIKKTSENIARLLMRL